MMDMMVTDMLRDHAFTRGLNDAQAGRLAALVTEVTFEENETCLVRGERSRFVYLIVSGSVAIELRTPNFAVCVQALGPGQLFGWSALLDLQDTVFDVRARERTTALRLEGASAAAAFHTDPALGVELLRQALRVAAERVMATETKFAEMCGVRL